MDPIEQFRSVTGAIDEVARNYLEACNDNLESAVELFFKHQQHNPIADNSDAFDAEPTTSSNIRDPIPQKSDTLVKESFNASYAPFRRIKNRNSVFDKFRDFEAETIEHTKAIKAAAAAAASAAADRNNVVGNAVVYGRVEKHTEENGKRKTLEMLFRPPLELMHHGNFESAKSAAVHKKCWLLVNVQNVEEFACQALNRDIWNHQMVIDLIDGNFILWQIYCDSADGNRFCTYYPVESYPFVCVIDPMTGELVNVFRVLKDTVAFCDSVVSFLESHPAPFDFDHSTPVENSLFSLSSNSSFDKAGEMASLSNNTLKRKLPPESSNSVDESLSDDSSDVPAKFAKTKDPNFERGENNDEDSTEATVNGCNNSREEENWQNYCVDEGNEIQVMFRSLDGNKRMLKLRSRSKLKAIQLYASNELNLSFDRYTFVLNYPKRVLNQIADPLTTLEDLGFERQEVIFIEE